MSPVTSQCVSRTLSLFNNGTNASLCMSRVHPNSQLMHDSPQKKKEEMKRKLTHDYCIDLVLHTENIQDAMKFIEDITRALQHCNSRPSILFHLLCFSNQNECLQQHLLNGCFALKELAIQCNTRRISPTTCCTFISFFVLIDFST